jgi:hypothetical protein
VVRRRPHAHSNSTRSRRQSGIIIVAVRANGVYEARLTLRLVATAASTINPAAAVHSDAVTGHDLSNLLLPRPVLLSSDMLHSRESWRTNHKLRLPIGTMPPLTFSQTAPV